MDAPACAIGRLADGGAWIGFAPTLDEGYALVIGGGGRSARGEASADDLVALALAYFEESLDAPPWGNQAGGRSSADDLVALALAYFEESLDAPPEDLAATHADIGGIVRHAADRAAEDDRPAFREAVDAIDDGLAADVVIERLAHAFGAGGDPVGHLRRRAAELERIGG